MSSSLFISWHYIDDLGYQNSCIGHKKSPWFNLSSEIAPCSLIEIRNHLQSLLCQWPNISRLFIWITSGHFETSAKVENFACGELFLNQVKQILSGLQPVSRVAASPNVWMNLFDSDVLSQLFQVLMPYSKAIFWASYHGFGVIARSKTRIYSYSCYLLTKLFILHQNVKLMHWRGNYFDKFRSFYLPQLIKLFGSNLLCYQLYLRGINSCFNDSPHLIHTGTVKVNAFSFKDL